MILLLFFMAAGQPEVGSFYNSRPSSGIRGFPALRTFDGRRGISHGGAEQIFVAHFETECINSRVEFEYDPAKSALNLAKHGIDFQKIQEIWNSKVVAAPSHNPSENRWMAIGSVDSKFWTVIITIRNKKIRIISARRSRKNEIEHYKNI